MIWESGGTQAQIDSAYVDVQLIERELNKLKENKEGAVLRSPIDGVVSQLADVRAGDSVSSGQTVATVIDTSALYIAVQPDDLTKFPVDTKVQIRINKDYYDGVVFMDPPTLADYQAEYAEDSEAVKEDYVDEVVAAMEKPVLVESKSSKIATVSKSSDSATGYTASVNVEELKSAKDELEKNEAAVFVTYVGADGKLVRKSVKYKVVNGKLVLDLPADLAQSGKAYNIDVIIEG